MSDEKSVSLETGDETVRVKLPQKRNREQFGCAELMMGANHIRIRWFDGVTRMGRIKGKITKKVWLREGISRMTSAISFTVTPGRRSSGYGGAVTCEQAAPGILPVTISSLAQLGKAHFPFINVHLTLYKKSILNQRAGDRFQQNIGFLGTKKIIGVG